MNPDETRNSDVIYRFRVAHAEMERERRREARRMWFARASRNFWRSFWSSLGWVVPIYFGVEWFIRHHAK